jgi:cytoskeletal protein RodZ
MENHDATNDNTQEPAYRHPKVQNFRTLKSDILNIAQKENKSLAQIVIASKEKAWEEKAGVGVEKKVYVENKYDRPLYKVLLFVLVVGATALFLLRTFIFPAQTPQMIQEPQQEEAAGVTSATSEESVDDISTTSLENTNQ